MSSPGSQSQRKNSMHFSLAVTWKDFSQKNDRLQTVNQAGYACLVPNVHDHTIFMYSFSCTLALSVISQSVQPHYCTPQAALKLSISTALFPFGGLFLVPLQAKCETVLQKCMLVCMTIVSDLCFQKTRVL